MVNSVSYLDIKFLGMGYVRKYIITPMKYYLQREKKQYGLIFFPQFRN